MELRPYWFERVNRLRFIVFFTVLACPAVLIAGLANHDEFDAIGVVLLIVIWLLAIAYTVFFVMKYVIVRSPTR
jgi:hypothetical protein